MSKCRHNSHSNRETQVHSDTTQFLLKKTLFFTSLTPVDGSTTLLLKCGKAKIRLIAAELKLVFIQMHSCGKVFLKPTGLSQTLIMGIIFAQGTCLGYSPEKSH